MLLHKVCHIDFFKLALLSSLQVARLARSLSLALSHPHSVYATPLLLLFEYGAVIVAVVVCFCIFIHSFDVALHPKSVVTVFRSHFHAIFRGYTLQLDYKQRKSHVHSLARTKL